MSITFSNHGWMKDYCWAKVKMRLKILFSTAYIYWFAYYCFLFFLFRSGKKWFERRKIITPAFHFKILEEYVEIFDRLGNVFVNKTLAKFDVKDEVEIYPLAILYALDVMCGECLQMESEINSRTQRYRTNCVRRTVRVWCVWCVFVMRAAGWPWNQFGFESENKIVWLTSFYRDIATTQQLYR